MPNHTNFNVISPGMAPSQLPHFEMRPNAYMSSLRSQLVQQPHAESLIHHADYDQQQGRNFAIAAVNMMEPEKGQNVDSWA